MISTIKQNGATSPNVNEYIIDEEADVVKLPNDISAGSTAFVAATGAVYMLNNKKEWVMI